MADLKPLVPKWRGDTLTVGDLAVATVLHRPFEAPLASLPWRVWLASAPRAWFETEAEARAWAEEQLYGYNEVMKERGA